MSRQNSGPTLRECAAALGGSSDSAKTLAGDQVRREQAPRAQIGTVMWCHRYQAGCPAQRSGSYEQNRLSHFWHLLSNVRISPFGCHVRHDSLWRWTDHPSGTIATIGTSLNRGLDVLVTSLTA